VLVALTLIPKIEWSFRDDGNKISLLDAPSVQRTGV